MSKYTRILLSVLVLGLGLAATPVHAQAGAVPSIEPTPAAPSPAARQVLDSLLFDYEVVELPLQALERRVRNGGRLDLVLRGTRYDLEVAPIDLRDPSYRSVLMTPGGPVEVPSRPSSTYAGTLAHDRSAVVRLTATRGLFVGYVRTDREWLFVDPLRDYVPGAGARLAVIYTEADVRPDAAGPCGVEGLQVEARRLGVPATLGEKNHNTLRRVDIATDADGEYFQAYGNPGTFNRILALVNGIDGIYRTDVNLFFNITFQQAWTNPATDPYTSSDASTTLNQFTSWWNSNRSTVNRDVAHLFSAKNFSGSIIGIAWVAVVCNSPSLSYGVSEDFGSQFLRTELMAHEVGHNFAAQHDDQIGCAGVSCNGAGPIMCSIIQTSGTNRFSSCSISAINTHTHNNGSCLN